MLELLSGARALGSCRVADAAEEASNTKCLAEIDIVAIRTRQSATQFRTSVFKKRNEVLLTREENSAYQYRSK
eukprot:378186-Amphidinium_carterae.1